MTGASKILTVSYGTFSCTLEGFDDPFNTMKAIAEYFRDLAAGDRYFGAEPPTPDAAMLHRIAEREIQRRVEAKIQDNGVILRAGEAAETPITATEPARPGLLDAPLLEAALAPAEEPAPPANRPAPNTEVGPEVSPESVAARLQRIRARHAQTEVPASTTAKIATLGAIAADSYIEDQHAEPEALIAEMPSFAAAATLGATTEHTDLNLDDFAPEAEGAADLSAEFAPQIAPQPDNTLIALTDQSDGLAADDALLASLSDTLSDEAETPKPDDLGAADQPSDAVNSDDFDDDALLSRLISTQTQTDQVITAEDSASLAQAATEEVLTVESLLIDQADQIDHAGPAAAPAAVIESSDLEADFEDTAEDQDDELTLEALTLESLSLESLNPDSPALAPEATKTVAQDAQALDNMADIAAKADDQDLPTEPVAEASPAAAEDTAARPTSDAAPRARARVIRIRRADTTGLAAQTPAAEAQEPQIGAEEPAQNLAEGPAQGTALSDEAEAALQAELAALEAEIGAVMAEPAAPPATPAPAAPQAASAPRQMTPPAEDAAVSRLMAEAASHMGGEENRRRQSAIAHLKAAVAATEADRAVTTAKGAAGGQRIDPYRDDLDRVVRPRRPQSEAASPRPQSEPGNARPTQTAEAPRPTPLVLVSAQRIDQISPQPNPAGTTPRVVMPVRPRRPSPSGTAPTALNAAAPVPAPRAAHPADPINPDLDDILTADEAENVFSDATSFQDFADQLGAEALPDLLEAAAVYCAEVLQRPEFSRPLVVRQIASLPGQAETSREDYLRGFGTLLRQGRITKVKRGMFALTDRSPYLAEARKLAG
ncbi:hypothetical protein [Tabrizicola sp.]|uniref:hypothetical protein n=1 Tax=Tabrizicola sp. TaxID=2005166 RepID=UPI003D2C6911